MRNIEGYSARYYQRGERVVEHSPSWAPYAYTAYIGPQDFELAAGDCAFMLSPELDAVLRLRGEKTLSSGHFAVVVRGYAPDDAQRVLLTGMNLPYVNGCSIKQLFPPERAGDPCMQQLWMPPFSKEQAHHIHPTARVLLVSHGSGVCVLGMEGKTERVELAKGGKLVLDPMCPHHFETRDEPLSVLPVHVWSSTPGERSHPMMAGTHFTGGGA